jgi:signal transduction histidine kinase
MDRKTWGKFIKDNWLYSLIYFLAIICIILFYQLNSKTPVEILYPVSIGIYAYLILMVIRGITYFGFLNRLRKCIHNPQYDLRPLTGEQQEVSTVIGAVHQSYIRQLHALQAENTAQQQFLSQWIHNLKTPISVIALTTQKPLIKMSEAAQVMASISEENDKLYHSVDQLLSLIRLENFAKDYIPERMDLAEELRLVINGMKNQFVIYHVFPELKLLTADTIAFSDRKWHKLMLEQFISNAVKYSRKPKPSADESSIAHSRTGEEVQADINDSYGEKENYINSEGYTEAMEEPLKKVWITLHRDGEELILSIRDEGIGIPEYDLNRIFEPFFTGDNGREIRNATGIGLYIADVAARRLGHRLEVESEVSKGTTVTIHYKPVNLSKL